MSSKNGALSVWAVKCGAFVEFRLFREPPSVKFSKLVKFKVVEFPNYDYIGEPPYYVKRMVQKKVKVVLSQASFIGGRLVCFAKLYSVWSRLKLNVKDGK